MKSYSIPSAKENNVPARATPAPKTRKTILAVITLVITGFLIIKLQRSEPVTTATAASATVIEKKSTPEKATVKVKEEARKKEVIIPANHITAKIKWRKNLVRETVLEGTLTNTAANADFKDPVITITWLSRTNTPLATTTHPLYEYLGAKKTISYKLKLKAPAKFAAIKASVGSATVL